MNHDDQKDRSFVARFGATIVRGGIASIPNALYRYQGELGLSAQQTWFVSAILARKWDSDMPMPSLKQMADQSGVSRVSLHNYQRELVQAGWLRVINRQNAQGGKDTNIFDFEPLFRRLEEMLIRDRGEESDSQESGKYTPHVKTSLHTHVNPSEHPHVSTSVHLKEPVFKEAKKEVFNISNIRKSNSSNEHSVDNTVLQQISLDDTRIASRNGPDTHHGVEGIGSILNRVAPQSEIIQPEKRQRGRPRKFQDEESQMLLNYVSDFAREFADKATLNQSATRIVNLYRKWGKGNFPIFIDLLYQARATTKAQNNIRTSKFAYFCSVLEDLLGLKEEQPSVSGHHM